MSIEIGCRVKVVDSADYPFLNNLTGIVRAHGGGVAAVDFDDSFELAHSCGGRCDSGYYVSLNELLLIETPSSQGDKTGKSPVTPPAMTVFRDYISQCGFPISDVGARNIINTWTRQKRRIRELLSRHPNWDEEQNAVIFSRDEERAINADSYRAAIYELCNYLFRYLLVSGAPSADRAIIQDILNFFHGECSIAQHLNEQDAVIIQERFGVKAVQGTKLSRIINAVMKKYGLNKITSQILPDGTIDKTQPSYDKLFALVADTVNPLNIKRFTALSINIMDYITMSHGNGWTSCHNVGEQCKVSGWGSGTLSYALDDVSMVFYTADGEYEGRELWNQPKITRQMFHINENNMIIQGRLYPCSSNEAKVEEYRAIVESIISSCLDIPNLWEFKSLYDLRDATAIITHNNGATNYQDYFHNSGSGGSYSAFAIHPKGSAFSNICIGSRPICVRCGEPHSRESSLQCSSCYTGENYLYLHDNVVICPDCGSRIFIRDALLDGDKYYCKNCRTICKDCEEIITGPKYEVYNGGFICESCASSDYWYPCDSCGLYHNDDTTRYIEDTEENICDDCYDNGGYFYCEVCERYFSDKEYHHTDCDDRYVCNRCFEEDYEVCTDCGDDIRKVEAEYDNDGNPYCENCFHDNFTWCDECGDPVRDSEIFEVCGSYYCEACVLSAVSSYVTDDIDEDDIKTVASRNFEFFLKIRERFNYLGHEELKVYEFDRYDSTDGIKYYVTDENNNRDFIITDAEEIIC